MQTMFSICSQNISTYNKHSTINTHNTNVTLSKYYWNTNNTDNTINTYNIDVTSSCGSGKKYKQCCGK